MGAHSYALANGPAIAADIAQVMSQHGMAPLDWRDLRTDGGISRFDCDGDRAGRKNGWAVIHADGPRPVVVFGHWSRGISQTVVLGSTEPMSSAERERQHLAMEQAKRDRQAMTSHRQANARREANALWLGSMPASQHHPYVTAKKIAPDGLRITGGVLLVPMRDTDGSLWNVQRIQPNGSKRFLRGGRVTGLYACISGAVGEHLLICEGWATGRSLHTATGLPVAVAFSAGNLIAVAQAMRAKYPLIRITLAADNDLRQDGTNPGVQAATAAAAAVNGFLAVPPVAGDFNDLATAAHSSTDAICEVLNRDDHE